jgi:hypothetical protein
MRFGRDVRPANVGALVRLPILLTLTNTRGGRARRMHHQPNASQPLQPLPPGTPRVVCSPFNPIQYAQTCGFYVGGHHRSH